MSSPPKNAGQRQPAGSSPPPKRFNAALISGVIGAVAVIIIIGYAVLHANHAVPGAAVATDAAQLPAQLPVGSKAPAFVLHSGIGSFSSSQLAGTPYLLEIFATWCPHCQRMTKVLRDVRTRVPESQLAMLSVTGSPYGASSTPDNIVQENQQDVNAFESTYGVTWPTFFDANLAVAKQFGVNGFPTIFVVDKKGKIVYSGSGEVSKDELLAAIRRARG